LYQLGLVRTSLPVLMTNWVKQTLQPKSGQRAKDNKFWALRDVSFELGQGESLALVGANGAGKTTILKLLANITKPTSGSIKTNGNLSALIELGAGFHPDLTGRENIYLNGTILGLSYSSGMTVRLGFAVASHIRPAILLVDEVLAVGDASFQQKCLERIRSLIKGGTSIVFVSHNIYLVQAVCNVALYLEKGLVKMMGNTKEVIDAYEQDLHNNRISKFSNTVNEQSGDSEHLEITKVEVEGEQTGTKAFSSKRPVRIRIHYNAYEPIGNVHVSVFIKRSDGLTCCMMRTKLDDFDLTLDRGLGVVSLDVDPLQLITGTYYAEAWFLNDTDSMTIVQRAGRSNWFSVKGSVLSYADDSGVFEPSTRWHHEQRVPDHGAKSEL
jgi:ABC-type polysaccharide/polyol phosphate transport system ATPase subunit